MPLEDIQLLYDYEAEKRFLGALALEPYLIKQYVHWSQEVFSDTVHKAIRKSIRELEPQSDGSIATDTLYSKVSYYNSKIPNSMIEEVLLSVLSASNLKNDAEIIIDYYRLRKLRIMNNKLSAQITSKDQHDKIETTIQGMLQLSRETIYEEEGLDKILDEVLDSTCEPTRFLTGYTKMDMLIGGFKPGQLVVLGARPGMGKTSLMLNMAVKQAINGIKSMFISLEMSNRELVQRAFSSISGIHYKKIEQKNFNTEDIQALGLVKEILKTKPITFVDNAFGFNKIIHIIRNKHMKDGLDTVYIDYLQLLSLGNAESNRTLEIGAFTRQFKLLAKELGITIFIGSQLNRGVEGRFDKRPLLSDLRASGSIEQDADIVFLMYREAYYEPDLNEIDAKKLEINIAKHRNGASEKFEVGFNGPTMEIFNLT